MYFVERGLNQFQKNILDRLDDHFLSNIISNMAFDLHYARLIVAWGQVFGFLLTNHSTFPPTF
jgi:hypothetical protein